MKIEQGLPVAGYSAAFGRFLSLLCVAALALVMTARAVESQGIGTLSARARVLNAEPVRAGMQAAARIVEGWDPRLEQIRRVETSLATVTVKAEVATAVLSINFLRN